MHVQRDTIAQLAQPVLHRMGVVVVNIVQLVQEHHQTVSPSMQDAMGPVQVQHVLTVVPRVIIQQAVHHHVQHAQQARTGQQPA